jgi:hypothetical protein
VKGEGEVGAVPQKGAPSTNATDFTAIQDGGSVFQTRPRPDKASAALGTCGGSVVAQFAIVL